MGRLVKYIYPERYDVTKWHKQANRVGHRRNNRGETSYWTLPVMYESSDKRIKRYVHCLTSELKTCIIHVPEHSSDECKILVNFGTEYAKGNLTKDHGNHPVPKKILTGSWKKNPLSIIWWMRFYYIKHKK